jgi:hypothetical protein
VEWLQELMVEVTKDTWLHYSFVYYKTFVIFFFFFFLSTPSIPEAIPLRNIKAKTIIKTLTILLQQVRHAFIIKQFKSNAYHPESQGVLERLHNILEKYESILFIQSK